MIKDLRHINDRKNLLDAIEEFRKIMSKDKNKDSERVDNNPLVKGTGTPSERIRDYVKIESWKRIFAEL